MNPFKNVIIWIVMLVYTSLTQNVYNIDLINLIKLGWKGSDSKFVLHQRQANKDQEGDWTQGLSAQACSDKQYNPVYFKV